MAIIEKPEVSELQVRPGELPPGLTAEQVRSHVIAPAHVRDVKNDDDDTPATAALPPRPPGALVHCDIDAFGTAIHAKLKSSVVGYVFQVRRNGAKVYERRWNWAQTPIDGNLGWTENTRMHVASVSKLLTAVGMVKALDSRPTPILWNATISDYLPTYWKKGPNIDKITFAHLLTHKSGFVAGGSDFATMKAQVAAGVTSMPGSSRLYRNMNYGLCRILIPIVIGVISKNHDFGPGMIIDQDGSWDATTINQYRTCMQNHVFTPAGVANAGFAATAGGALAYPQPHANQHGWNSGDLQTVSGGVGWRLSIKELLDVMHHVRRKNTIVSKETAKKIRESEFGVTAMATPAGTLYGKSGGWGGVNAEQCVAYYLPEGLEAAMFVNSPIQPNTPSNYELSDHVATAYLGSLSA